MKYQIVARSGCGDFCYMLVLEEEPLVTVEDIQELEKKVGGRLLKIEGEECIFVPLKAFSTFLNFIKENKGNTESFQTWWERGDIVEIEGERGKLFIIKKI